MATVLVPGRRNGNGRGALVSAPSVVRCAVYARQSVSEGTGESASIGVQKDACLAAIASHAAEGWTALPDVYSDQGISGATLQRPAMQRLLADVAADRIDAIVTYKLDRISRNLADFAALVADLDRRGVRLVSVTQSFDTKSAIGRLTLGILMSFSEFERSLVSERTKDAVQAARRKGRWTGGCVPWGFVLVAGKLVPDPVEAHRVAETFRVYLECGSLIATASALNARGWRTKVSATKNGGTRGGVAWSKSSVHRILTSPIYIGKITAGEEAVVAEHEAIVPVDVWAAIQERLQANGGPHTRAERVGSDALLAGVAFCSCGAALTPTFVSRRVGHAKKRFSYYICGARAKRGKAVCGQPYIPAHRLESAVVEKIAEACRENPALVGAIVEAAKEQIASQRKSLASEKRALGRAMRQDDSRQAYRERLGEIEREAAGLAGMVVEEGDVARTVAEFDALWASLVPRERRRVVEMIVERVVVASDGGPVAVTLHVQA